jgi:hypothetical protein
MEGKTNDRVKKGPRPPPQDSGSGEGKLSDKKGPRTPGRKKKKAGPAPPRPPSDDEDEEVEVFGTVDEPYHDASSSDESKTASSKTTVDDPIHTKVFRSAESDEEEDNAAAIQPAGAIDMAELMMNIRSAPGAIDNTDSPEVNLNSRRRGRVSASKLNDSDDEFHIPTLGGSPTDSEREDTRSSRRDHREKRERDKDKESSSSSRSNSSSSSRRRDQNKEGRDSSRSGRSGSGRSSSSRGEGKTSSSSSSRRNYTSETDNDETLNAHDRSFQKATRVARSIPDAVVRAVGYHERVIQLMQRDDFDADEQQLQALATFTKSCKRTARLVEGVLKHGAPNDDYETASGGGRTTSSSSSSNGKGKDSRSRTGRQEENYNPKEDAIREESKTDLQELLDDINRFDNANSSSSSSGGSQRKDGRGKKNGRSKKAMAAELLKRVNSPDFNVFEFLKEPVKKEYGMIQFRIVGDHSDNELFVLFDYGNEPESSNLVMTCDRAKKATSAFGGKKKTFDIRCEERVLGRCERIRKGKILQFNIYSNEAASSKGNGSIFSDPSKNKNKSKKDKNNAALRKQLGAVEISNSKDKPRSMIVLLPDMRLNNDTNVVEPVVWQPWHEKEEMLACWHAGHFEHMSFWENKKPQYDEDLGAYTLDFDGRVTMASSKNFLLVSSHDIRGPVGVRFGRVEDSQFVMDVAWPCSPLQAMGIALASVLTKTTG